MCRGGGDCLDAVDGTGLRFFCAVLARFGVYAVAYLGGGFSEVLDLNSAAGSLSGVFFLGFRQSEGYDLL